MELISLNTFIQIVLMEDKNCPKFQFFKPYEYYLKQILQNT